MNGNGIAVHQMGQDNKSIWPVVFTLLGLMSSARGGNPAAPALMSNLASMF